MLQLDALAPILDGLGLLPALSADRLPGGSGESWRIDLEGGAAVVLKIYDDRKNLPRHDTHVARLLAALDLPVTQYLLVDDSQTRLPFRFALTNFIPGGPATAFASHRHYHDLFRQIGGLASKLHSIAMPAFGSFPNPAYSEHSDYIRSLADHAFGQCLAHGADPTLLARLQRIFDSDFAAIVPVTTQAVFAHDDLHPGNVLAVETDAGLSISGLIDFGNARASCAVMDLAKTIFICEHDAPGSGAAILEGYGAIDHPSPTEALAFYTLLHRLIMWWWLRHVGVIESADADSDIMTALRITASAR